MQLTGYLRKFKWLLVIAATMSCSSMAEAQWSIGGVVGINAASIKVTPEISSEAYSGRAAFGLGVVVDRQLMDNLDLHMEPMYLQKGAKVSETGFSASFKVNYFELPVMIRYSVPLDLPVMPYAMAGPSVGLLAKAKYDSGENEQDATDETRKIDFSAGFGAGVQIPEGNRMLFAEVRYLLGFVNINNQSDESTVKNRGLQILVGITIPLGS
jgi:opacity protein-like surface antigen